LVAQATVADASIRAETVGAQVREVMGTGFNRVGTHVELLSRLDRTAYSLAVYASQFAVTRVPRATRFSARWPTVGRVGSASHAILSLFQ
jgi:hypothetical protein